MRLPTTHWMDENEQQISVAVEIEEVRVDHFEYCRTLNIQISTLEVWVAEQWIVPSEMSAEASFRPADVARGRLILDLMNTMGVNEAGVDVIIDLIDQLHCLRANLRLLMDALGQEDDATRLSVLLSLERQCERR